MKAHHPVLVVAHWEFWRYFKVRDHLLALAIGVFCWGVAYVAQRVVGASGGDVRIAVLHSERLPGIGDLSASTLLPEGSRLKLESHDADEEIALRTRVERRDLDGLLIIGSPDEMELLVHRKPLWDRDLLPALSALRTQFKLSSLPADPAALADAFSRAPVTITYPPGGGSRIRQAEEATAAVAVGLLCIGVLLGLSWFFTGLAGEKQQRVTEQIVAAVTTQNWVDGKILGLTGVALASMIGYGLTLVLFLFGLKFAGVDVPLPAAAASPGRLLAYLLLSFLGLAMWNCFFAAIAATINDPASSARTSLLFLPMIPLMIAFAGLRRPDSIPMQVLSLVPGTSSTVMPLRLVLGDVAWWEVPVAVVLLILATAIFRRLAGKIFAAGILLTGKELSFREMWRCVRTA